MSAKTRPSRASTLAALRKRAGELDDGAGRASKTAGRTQTAPQALPSIDINQEIARERKLRNDNAEQDIALKRTTLRRLFLFLTGETVAIFLFALFQATHWPPHFHLEEWSFNLLVGATIAQITGMLYVAVRYLFPNGRSNSRDVE
jgi:hypothetical protein